MAGFYAELEPMFTSWAQNREDIRAVFIVGSRARKDHPADEWSDLDLMIYTSKQADYLNDQEWIQELGDIRISVVSQTAGGDWECLALFHGGWQVDFVLHTTDELNYMVENRIVPDNFHRGVKVLVDKEQIAENILPKVSTAPKAVEVTQALFDESGKVFWFLALYIAKQILRNELWVVKSRDSMLKDLLLQMIEWHQRAIHTEEYDTWHAGRFLCEWAGEEINTRLGDCFGHFDRKDSWRALLATLSLYSDLSHEVAKKMNLTESLELKEEVFDYVHRKEESL